jgi:hypothetical protein
MDRIRLIETAYESADKTQHYTADQFVQHALDAHQLLCSVCNCPVSFVSACFVDRLGTRFRRDHHYRHLRDDQTCWQRLFDIDEDETELDDRGGAGGESDWHKALKSLAKEANCEVRFTIPMSKYVTVCDVYNFETRHRIELQHSGIDSETKQKRNSCRGKQCLYLGMSKAGRLANLVTVPQKISWIFDAASRRPVLQRVKKEDGGVYYRLMVNWSNDFGDLDTSGGDVFLYLDIGRDHMLLVEKTSPIGELKIYTVKLIPLSEFIATVYGTCARANALELLSKGRDSIMPLIVDVTEESVLKEMQRLQEARALEPPSSTPEPCAKRQRRAAAIECSNFIEERQKSLERVWHQSKKKYSLPDLRWITVNEWYLSRNGQKAWDYAATLPDDTPNLDAPRLPLLVPSSKIGFVLVNDDELKK